MILIKYKIRRDRPCRKVINPARLRTTDATNASPERCAERTSIHKEVERRQLSHQHGARKCHSQHRYCCRNPIRLSVNQIQSVLRAYRMPSNTFTKLDKARLYGSLGESDAFHAEWRIARTVNLLADGKITKAIEALKVRVGSGTDFQLTKRNGSFVRTAAVDVSRSECLLPAHSRRLYRIIYMC